MTSCTKCGERANHKTISLPRHNTSAVAWLVGGIIFALLWSLSRKQPFKCNKCEAIFESHTAATKGWLCIFWGLIVLAVAGLILAIVSPEENL